MTTDNVQWAFQQKSLEPAVGHPNYPFLSSLKQHIITGTPHIIIKNCSTPSPYIVQLRCFNKNCGHSSKQIKRSQKHTTVDILQVCKI